MLDYTHIHIYIHTYIHKYACIHHQMCVRTHTHTHSPPTAAGVGEDVPGVGGGVPAPFTQVGTWSPLSHTGVG